MNTSSALNERVFRLLGVAATKAGATVFLLGIFTMLGFCSCGKSASNLPKVSMDKDEEPQVVILSWDEYFDPAVVENFTTETGIEVKILNYESTEVMEEKLKSNPQNYDVLITEQAAVQPLTSARMLSKLDFSKLPNLSNMDERYMNQEFDPGNKFTLPYMWGTTVLAYRKDHFKETPAQSLKLLFNPEYSGKVSMLDERSECFAMMLQKLNISVAHAGVSELERARDEMIDLVSKQKVRFGSDNNMKEHLLEGVSSIAMIYSGDAAIIGQENPNIGYFIPIEGAMMWVDNFAIPRDSIRQNNAHRFINYMMGAKVAAQSSNFLRYASPNKAAQPFLEKSLVEDATIYPSAQLLARCSSMPLWDMNEQRTMNEGWRMIQDVVRQYDKESVANAAPQNKPAKDATDGPAASEVSHEEGEAPAAASAQASPVLSPR